MSALPRAPQPGHYLVSHTSAEHHRLRVQASAWEEATERMLAKSGLAACVPDLMTEPTIRLRAAERLHLEAKCAAAATAVI